MTKGFKHSMHIPKQKKTKNHTGNMADLLCKTIKSAEICTYQNTHKKCAYFCMYKLSFLISHSLSSRSNFMNNIFELRLFIKWSIFQFFLEPTHCRLIILMHPQLFPNVLLYGFIIVNV